MEWRDDLDICPFGEVVLVKNDLLEKPVRATRGYVYNGAVHPNQKFFTSQYTPDDLFPMPAGRLVCPTHWAPEES